MLRGASAEAQADLTSELESSQDDADKLVEESGLDQAEHGELGYHDDEIGRLTTEGSIGTPALQPAVAPATQKY